MDKCSYSPPILHAETVESIFEPSFSHRFLFRSLSYIYTLIGKIPSKSNVSLRPSTYLLAMILSKIVIRDSPFSAGEKGLSATSEQFAALYEVCSIIIYIYKAIETPD